MDAYALRSKHTGEYVEVIDKVNNKVFWWTKKKANSMIRPAEVMNDWLKQLDVNLEIVKVKQ